MPKTGNFCRILKKSVGVRVSKSVKYCLNHKGFYPIILLSKVGCFLLPSVYVAFSDILMPEELPQIHSMYLVVEFEGAEVIKIFYIKSNDLIMFGLSEKHTKFEKIFIMVLTNQLIYLVNVKTTRKIFFQKV